MYRTLLFYCTSSDPQFSAITVVLQQVEVMRNPIVEGSDLRGFKPSGKKEDGMDLRLRGSADELRECEMTGADTYLRGVNK